MYAGVGKKAKNSLSVHVFIGTEKQDHTKTMTENLTHQNQNQNQTKKQRIKINSAFEPWRGLCCKMPTQHMVEEKEEEENRRKGWGREGEGRMQEKRGLSVCLQYSRRGTEWERSHVSPVPWWMMFFPFSPLLLPCL